MIERLPYYYRKSKIVDDLYNVITKSLNEIESNIELEDLRLFIATTDDFVLHEKDVGLSSIISDDETKRARVIARLCGDAVLTPVALIELISIYEKNGCTIKENCSEYTIVIIFSEKGKPNNFNEIQEAVNEVIPAHIKAEYEFIKNTWLDIREKLSIWNNTSALIWDNIQIYRRKSE